MIRFFPGAPEHFQARSVCSNGANLNLITPGDYTKKDNKIDISDGQDDTDEEATDRNET